MIRSLSITAALVLGLAVTATSFAQQDGNSGTPDENPVVALVDGSEIRQSDVAVAYARLPDRFKQVPINVLFPQIVQQLVDGELLAVAGRADDLQDSEEVREHREIAAPCGPGTYSDRPARGANIPHAPRD